MKIKALVILSAAVLTLGVSSAIASEVATVDVAKVVNSSPKVQALKKEQEAKAKDLVTFVKKAQKDVANVNDVKKKQDLEMKYNKQYAEKREAIAKDYDSKRQKIEDEISKIIAEQAKAKGYDMVIPKNVALYSTTDITDEVVKAVSAAQKKK